MAKIFIDLAPALSATSVEAQFLNSLKRSGPVSKQGKILLNQLSPHCTDFSFTRIRKCLYKNRTRETEACPTVWCIGDSAGVFEEIREGSGAEERSQGMS